MFINNLCFLYWLFEETFDLLWQNLKYFGDFVISLNLTLCFFIIQCIYSVFKFAYDVFPKRHTKFYKKISIVKNYARSLLYVRALDRLYKGRRFESCMGTIFYNPYFLQPLV